MLELTVKTVKITLCGLQYKKYNYRGLHGMLSLWTVTSNESSYNNWVKNKIGQVEARRISTNK